MISYKTGKKPATYDSRDLLFTQFVNHKVTLRNAPVGFGNSRVMIDWGMLGNDRFGNCAWAGPAHEHMLWTRLSPVADAVFTEQNVLSDYAAATGFDPVTGANDNGTDMRQGLTYRRQVGIVDSAGTRHKIGGFVALEPGNWTQLLHALMIFDAVAMGIEFPTSAMDQFNEGKPWSVVAGATVDGGHYVPVVARPGTSTVDVVTWGKTQPVTAQFVKKYADEMYGVFSEETLTNGKSPEGFEMLDFISALKGI